MPVTKTLTVGETQADINTDFGFTTPELDAATSAYVWNGSGGYPLYYTTNGVTPSGSSPSVMARQCTPINGNSLINALKVYTPGIAMDVAIVLVDASGNTLDTRILASGANQQSTIATWGFSGAHLAAATMALLDNRFYSMDGMVFCTNGANVGNSYNPITPQYALLPSLSGVTIAGNTAVKGLRFKDCNNPGSVVGITLYP